MLESTNNYWQASREFMGKAYQYLADADLPQASEKGWGAAVEMVKALSEERGWVHDNHRVLFRNVHRLIGETGDGELITLFGMGHNLHNNFYENCLPLADVQLYLQGVQTLLNKLEPLLETAQD